MSSLRAVVCYLCVLLCLTQHAMAEIKIIVNNSSTDAARRLIEAEDLDLDLSDFQVNEDDLLSRMDQDDDYNREIQRELLLQMLKNGLNKAASAVKNGAKKVIGKAAEVACATAITGLMKTSIQKAVTALSAGFPVTTIMKWIDGAANGGGLTKKFDATVGSASKSLCSGAINVIMKHKTAKKMRMLNQLLQELKDEHDSY